MKVASRLIDLINTQKKTNLHMKHAFLSFPCRCFARLQRCFVRLKRQTSQLLIIFMEELSYVLTQYFVSCVHVRCYFSLRSFFYFTLVCPWCGRTVARSLGVRSRDYQIFSDGQITTFPQLWGSAVINWELGLLGRIYQ